MLLPALLVTKSSLRSSGDRCIIVGARDFSPDAWGAGHLLPYEWLFALPLLYRKRNPASGCRADGSIIIGARDFSPDARGAGHLLPYEWFFVPSRLYRKRNPACGWSKSRFAGRNPHSVRSKSAGAARRRKSPQNFRSAGFVYPGSYLLSRDLSSDYHRRADVSLPGSEWDRVGPSGYDHQALALLSYLPGYHFCGGFLSFSGRLTSAWLACLCSAPSFLHA